MGCDNDRKVVIGDTLRNIKDNSQWVVINYYECEGDSHYNTTTIVSLREFEILMYVLERHEDSQRYDYVPLHLFKSLKYLYGIYEDCWTDEWDKQEFVYDTENKDKFIGLFEPFQTIKFIKKGEYK